MSILPMIGFAGNRPVNRPLLGADGPPDSGLNTNRTVLDFGCCPKLYGGQSSPGEQTVRKSLPVLVRNVFVSGRSGF